MAHDSVIPFISDDVKISLENACSIFGEDNIIIHSRIDEFKWNLE